MSITNFNPTTRFSNRVADYVKYRPRYPRAIIDFLRRECGLTSDSVVADIGSGTGFLSELFLENGNRVFAVEPNAEMRAAAEHLHGDKENFISVDGTAEATTLPENSTDVIAAGQAFHWFELDTCKPEFRRILVPEGWIILVWNNRRLDNPFLRQYESLLRQYGTDYPQIDHNRIDDSILTEFFGNREYRLKTFANSQIFDYAGLAGRLLSSSYAPTEDHPDHEPMLRALKRLFEQFQKSGTVTLLYDTRVYYGQFT